MKLLVRSVLRAAKPTQQTRALSSFREQAVRAVASKLRTDLESNPNLWLSVAAVVRVVLFFPDGAARTADVRL